MELSKAYSELTIYKYLYGFAPFSAPQIQCQLSNNNIFSLAVSGNTPPAEKARIEQAFKDLKKIGAVGSIQRIDYRRRRLMPSTSSAWKVQLITCSPYLVECLLWSLHEYSVIWSELVLRCSWLPDYRHLNILRSTCSWESNWRICCVKNSREKGMAELRWEFVCGAPFLLSLLSVVTFVCPLPWVMLELLTLDGQNCLVHPDGCYLGEIHCCQTQHHMDWHSRHRATFWGKLNRHTVPQEHLCRFVIWNLMYENFSYFMGFQLSCHVNGFTRLKHWLPFFAKRIIVTFYSLAFCWGLILKKFIRGIKEHSMGRIHN